MFSSLILGESHTGKSRSLGTLKGRTILFNFDPPDNVTSLRVPYVETKRLKDFWRTNVLIEKVLVVNYTAMPRAISMGAVPDPTKLHIESFIEDVNTLTQNLDKVDNLALETLGPFGDFVLDFIVAANGRKNTEIQDYKVAKNKIFTILGALMGIGKNVVVTGHLQSERDEITGRAKITPTIWGKDLPGTIPKYFGEVFQSVVIQDSTGKLKYMWQTQPEPGGLIGFLGSRKKDGLPKYIPQDFTYLYEESSPATAGK